MALYPNFHDHRHCIKKLPLPDSAMRFNNAEILKLKVPQRELFMKLPDLKISESLTNKSKRGLNFGYQKEKLQDMTKNSAVNAREYNKKID